MIKNYGYIILGLCGAVMFVSGILPSQVLADTQFYLYPQDQATTSVTNVYNFSYVAPDFPATSTQSVVKYSSTTAMTYTNAVNFCASQGKRLPYYSEFQLHNYLLGSTTFYYCSAPICNFWLADRLPATPASNVFGQPTTVGSLTSNVNSSTSTTAQKTFCVSESNSNTSTSTVFSALSTSTLLLGNATTTSMQDTNFGIGILITLGMLIFMGLMFNSFNKK